MDDVKKNIPLWISNLLVFGILISVALIYFLWQVNQTRQAFLENAKESALVLAAQMQLNKQLFNMFTESNDKIHNILYEKAASFVAYRDRIGPMDTSALSAFAEEAGFAGIKIIRENGSSVETPQGWSSSAECEGTAIFFYRSSEKQFCYFLPLKNSSCVMIGISVENTKYSENYNLNYSNYEKLVKESFSVVPGSISLDVDMLKPGENDITWQPTAEILKKDNMSIVRVRVPMKDSALVLSMNAEKLESSLSRLWRDFILFSLVLMLLGTLLSFFLYQRQSFYLTKVRNYERHLSKEREDGILGRAAASIAHEVRNPLNTLSMGLQRMQIEGQEILPEHQQLVSHMLDAVRRTNSIVRGLLNYVRPQVPQLKPMYLDQLLEKTLAPYLARCAENQILIEKEIHDQGTISGDPDLLEHVMENLINNALEAQPKGGFVHLAIVRHGKEVVLSIRNKGFSLTSDQVERIFEPYFTTKSTGTGLGLSISKRIVQAHQGRIEARCFDQGSLEIVMTFPLSGAAVKNGT
jgi:two-component system sensor histidine kinase HydH